MTTFDLGDFQKQISTQNVALPPVDKWDPDFCGDIDIQIKHDGSWFYMGTPIGRKSLVKLFASQILARTYVILNIRPILLYTCYQCSFVLNS